MSRRRNRGNLITRFALDFDLKTDEGRKNSFRQLSAECLGSAKALDNAYPHSIGQYMLTAHALELALKAFSCDAGRFKRGLSIPIAEVESDIEWLDEFHSASLRMNFGL